MQAVVETVLCASMEALLSSRDMRPSNSRDKRSEAVLGSSEKTLASREGQGLGTLTLLRREPEDMRCWGSSMLMRFRLKEDSRLEDGYRRDSMLASSRLGRCLYEMADRQLALCQCQSWQLGSGYQHTPDFGQLQRPSEGHEDTSMHTNLVHGTSASSRKAGLIQPAGFQLKGSKPELQAVEAAILSLEAHGAAEMTLTNAEAESVAIEVFDPCLVRTQRVAARA
ncbi:MAG: hypothetical protein FRX49_00616 [Trebouxia sp. A1-2]|nr:MAG: hypothetical protein FRX49_00616 [Trebouxia sp. A1-2]